MPRLWKPGHIKLDGFAGDADEVCGPSDLPCLPQIALMASSAWMAAMTALTSSGGRVRLRVPPYDPAAHAGRCPSTAYCGRCR
jgi:hypothetical protein